MRLTAGRDLMGEAMWMRKTPGRLLVQWRWEKVILRYWEEDLHVAEGSGTARNATNEPWQLLPRPSFHRRTMSTECGKLSGGLEATDRGRCGEAEDDR